MGGGFVNIHIDDYDDQSNYDWVKNYEGKISRSWVPGFKNVRAKDCSQLNIPNGSYYMCPDLVEAIMATERKRLNGGGIFYAF